MEDKKLGKEFFMNLKIQKITIGLLASVLLVSGCGKKIYTESGSGQGQVKVPETRPSEPLMPIDMGVSSQFAVFAYASITSTPDSSINGKVGLMPGTKEMIKLKSSEVSGGLDDILGSNSGLIQSDLLGRAKADMVLAYKKVLSLSADPDKIGTFQGDIGGKNLGPGVYQFNSGLVISKDFYLEGSENDVWIFKIPGHLRVGSDVHMFLNGGAKAKNIFWQVSGSTVLGANSDFSGTIISQQFVDLKNHAVLTGRAFAKNGFINLYKATINNL